MSAPVEQDEPGNRDGMCVAAAGCQRRALHGHLCGGHWERLSAMLRDVEDESAVLSSVPSMQSRPGNRGASLASERSPAKLEAVVANDPRRGKPSKDVDHYDPWAFDDTASVLDVLHGWGRIIREERRITPPEQITVSGEVDLWVRQLEWIVEQPWIDEAYGDVTRLLGQLRAANGHRAERPYSKCPRDIDGDLCPGEVWVQDEMQAVWRRYSDRCQQTWEQAPGAAVCDTCGASWVTESDKARLKLMVEEAAREAARPRTEDGRRMLTAQEMVDAGLVRTKSAVKTAYSRLGLVSTAGHYDPAIFSKATA